MQKEFTWRTLHITQWNYKRRKWNEAENKNDDGKTKHQLNIHEKIVIQAIVWQFIEMSIWISK